MPFVPLLAADVFDIARGIILFVILAGGVARLFIDANRAQKKAPAPPQQPKPARPGAPPPNRQQEAIRAEVDEFLRRSGRENGPRPEPVPAEARAQQAEPRPSKRPPRIEVIDDSDIQLKRRPRRSDQPRETEGEQRKRNAKRAGMSEEGTRPNFGGTSVALKTDRLGSQLSARAAELGHEIRQADERFESRIQEKFEHPIGTLANRQRQEAESLRVELARTTLADDLMQMLSSPAGVRQALVLHEILSRPVDRW